MMDRIVSSQNLKTTSDIVVAKEKQDHHDYQTIISKKTGNRDALAVGDIIDCNRLPILKTKLIRYINTTKEINHQVKNTNATVGTMKNQRRNSIVMLDRTTSSSNLKDYPLPSTRQSSSSSSSIVPSPSSIPAIAFTSKLKDLDIASLRSTSTDDKRRISLREHDLSSNPHSHTKSDNNDNLNTQLAHVLQLMTEAKHVIDPSRFYYDAGNQFSMINMYDRAIYCYKLAVVRVSAAQVVDAYYLPCDDKYKRKIERMSKFQLPEYMTKRAALREQLIFEENERQRIRAKLSHINLVRIYLLVDDYVDFNEAHKSITKAFGCCTTEGDDEHVDLLSTMHSLLKEYASMKRTEMPLSKQIMRNERGPIAEAHLAILLELESLYPQSADVHEWLGYRYSEKSDFEAARHHFKRLRDILEPVPDMKDTLLLWGSSVQLLKSGGDSDPFKIDLSKPNNFTRAERAQIKQAKRNVNKDPIIHVDNTELIVKKIDDVATNDHHQQLYPLDNLTLTNNSHENIISTIDGDSRTVATTSNMLHDYSWFRGVHTESTLIVYKAPMQGWNTIAGERKVRKYS